MKKWTVLLFALTFLCAPNSASAQMIADLRADVATPFGTYHPYLVSVRPAIPAITVAPDFSNVANFSRFQFTENELNLLRGNHFVVSPRRTREGTGYREMYDIYNEARELGIPILVTTDAMLHTFHLVFDRMLKTCEERHFYGLLGSMLGELYEETRAQQIAASDTLARWALWRNLEYLNVARSLFDTTFVPLATLGLCQQELDLIAQHVPFTSSPIFEYDEDYTQYSVRGHYTQSDSLRRYFETMMWLGRMTYGRLDSGYTLGAILLTQALMRAQIDVHPVLDDWDDIYQTTVFFVGKSDDLGPDQYRQIAQQVYGRCFLSSSPDTLAKRDLLSQFQQLAQALPGPKIEYPGQPAGFRLMGQRFIPDSYVLDELVFDKLPDARFMPTGLDVMAVLGSARALELLQQTPDWTNFPSYPAKLEALRQEFAAYPAETWAQNVYWNWLYSLMPLLYAKGEGYPSWMQTRAWSDKDLLAALGSWAELRHDTILYAKQSGTETGMKPDAVGKQGYVEPNPHLYARLASLAHFLQTGLRHRNLLFAEFETSLNQLHDVLIKLHKISEKELANLPLALDDYETILNIGKTLEQIVEFSQWPTGGPRPDNKDAMPVIADVHTDANSNTVLEEGVGYPYCVYAICSVEGQLVLTRGAGFSYHEFVWPSTDRLTDEAWRQMLQTASAPAPPAWSASFLAEADWKNPQPDFYYWKTGETLWLRAWALSDTVELGMPVQAEIQYGGSLSALKVWVESASGKKAFADSIARVSSTKCVAWIPTQGLQAGRACVVAQTPAPANFSGESVLEYRAGFIITMPSRVDDSLVSAPPRELALLLPWPNPFNANVTLAFELPKASFIELVVLDVTGRRVRNLANGAFPVGRHRLLWDGLDDHGRSQASGVYVVRLRVGKQAVTQKVVMVR